MANGKTNLHDGWRMDGDNAIKVEKFQGAREEIEISSLKRGKLVFQFKDNQPVGYDSMERGKIAIFYSFSGTQHSYRQKNNQRKRARSKT